MNKIIQVAIIGAGPAGIATALQLKRYEIDFIIFEKDRIGGLLLNANLVENYPGFPNGISGEKLVKLFETQLKKAKIKITFAEVSKLDFKNSIFLIKTKNKKLFKSKIVIIASGTKPKQPDLEIPKDCKGKIFYEVYPLLKFKNKNIGIVGAGDAAFDYSLNLSKRNNNITILNRTDKIKALPCLVKLVKSNPDILYIPNTNIIQVKHNKDKLIVKCKKNKTIQKKFFDYLIFAIGRVGQIDFFSSNINKNLDKLQRQNRLFLIGDVKQKIFRQTTIAIGDGILTAMKIAALRTSSTAL